MKFLSYLAILISLSFLCFSQLYAQNTSIGVKGAVGQSRFSNNEGGITAFRLGGFLTYSISRDFGVSGEVNFSRKGGQNASDQSIILDYVEVPILAQYFLGKASFRPKVIAGPYFAYMLQARRNKQQLSDYNTEDYGIMLGLGFNYSLPNRKWLYGDIRYAYGLEEVRGNSDQQNRGLSINLGLSFPLKAG